MTEESYTPTTNEVRNDYTPDTEQVRRYWQYGANAWFDGVARDDDTGPDGSIGAEFDRWLAGVKADARREGQAKAWDEGRQAGVDDMIAAEVGSFRRRKPNPYRNGAGQ